jgi:hypothetical protein
MNARLPIVLSIFLCSAGAASAQSTSSGVEVGVQTSFLRLSDSQTTSTGIGGRVSFDVTSWAALEAEGQFFPNDDVLLNSATLADAGIAYERRRADGFFGLKIGRRSDKLGLFAKARPGFTSLMDKGVRCLADVCALMLLARAEYRTEFAFDLGGVLELYPSRRTVARFDLGDTMIRHRSFAPPCWGSPCTSHNLTTRVGFGVRF